MLDVFADLLTVSVPANTGSEGAREFDASVRAGSQGGVPKANPAICTYVGCMHDLPVAVRRTNL